jgi:hypothetical protein
MGAKSPRTILEQSMKHRKRIARAVRQGRQIFKYWRSWRIPGVLAIVSLVMQSRCGQSGPRRESRLLI